MHKSKGKDAIKLNWQSVLRLLILATWSIFLLWTYFSGRVRMYIKIDYTFLTLIGGFLLLPMAFVQIKNLIAKEGHKAKAKDKTKCCHHDHNSFSLKDGVIYTIFLLPIVLGLIVTPQGLDSFAASKRGVDLESPISKSTAMETPQRKKTSSYNELNLLDLLTTAENDEKKIMGKAISTIGFVYKDENMSDDSFALLRFVITCCAADAQPIGVMVESENISYLENDQWVRVNGIVQIKEKEGERVLTIIADDVDSIPKPKEQYLY